MSHFAVHLKFTVETKLNSMSRWCHQQPTTLLPLFEFRRIIRAADTFPTWRQLQSTSTISSISWHYLITELQHSNNIAVYFTVHNDLHALALRFHISSFENALLSLLPCFLICEITLTRDHIISTTPPFLVLFYSQVIRNSLTWNLFVSTFLIFLLCKHCVKTNTLFLCSYLKKQ